MNGYYAPFYRPMNYYNPNAQNGFEGQNYAPQGYSNQQQNIQQNFQPNTDSTMIWVLGKNEAESYPVAPNCQVVLWDKNAPTIYVKSMSANGIPNMRTLDFVERTEIVQNAPQNEIKSQGDKFVTLSQFNDLKGDFDELRGMYNKLVEEKEQKTEEKPKNTTKKSKESD